MLPAVLRLADYEMLYLFELLHSKDTLGIPSVAASLFAEAGAVASVFNRKLAWLQPFVGVETGEELLTGRNEVLVRVRIGTALGDTI